MRNVRWFALVLVVAFAVPLLAADIQVVCEPGLRVYLDDGLAGVSTAEENGLQVKDVAPGEHRLRIENNGFVPQNITVEIRDAPIQIVVGPFKPAPQLRPTEVPRQQAVEGEGSLTIVTTPLSCVVAVDGKAQLKDVPRLTIGGVSAGEHTISFAKPGFATASGKVSVGPGEDVTVRCNLHLEEIEAVRQGKVEVIKARKVEVEPVGKGSLRVYSEPSGCTLHFLGEVIPKTTPVVNRSAIPAGDHLLIATWGDREVKGTITIKKNQRTIITIKFADTVNPFSAIYEPE